MPAPDRCCRPFPPAPQRIAVDLELWPVLKASAPADVDLIDELECTHEGNARTCDGKLAERPPHEALYVDALRDYHELSLIGHAFWILASHGVSEGGPFPLVCAACQKPWRCPEIIWAADWILKATQLGILEAHGLRLDANVLAIMATWGTEAVISGEAEAV